MALFDDFILGHADDMFNNGLSFRAVADTLRGNGLSFSDSKLREFRDTIAGNTTLNLNNFSDTFNIPAEYFTVTKDLPCGEYGIAVKFSYLDSQSGEPKSRHWLERVDSYTNARDFIDNILPDTLTFMANAYDINSPDVELRGGYIGEC